MLILDDYNILPHAQGIKLIPANKAMHNPINWPLKQIFKFDMQVYISNTEQRLLNINEQCAKICEFDSPATCYNKIASDFMERNSALVVESENKLVLEKNKSHLTELTIELVSGTLVNQITKKFPLYDDNNQLMGILGFSIDLKKLSVLQSIKQLSSMGLLNELGLNKPLLDKTSSNHDFNFSPREKTILTLLIRGKTAKQIAQTLNISYRTVETHLENAKIKTNARSKSELIDKIYESSMQIML